jgi:uncharacterized membrane protein
LDAPPAALLYLSRFINLIVYLAMVAMALRQLPGFQIPLLALAMMPMALSQAASASWDGMVYGTGFFLCAYILRLAWDPHIDILQPRHYATLVGAVMLAGLCKTDAWLIPLLMIVPAAKFRGVRQKWAVFVGAVLFVLLVIAGWNYANREDMARWVDHVRDYRQIYLTENLAFAFQHPGIMLQTFLRTWSAHGLDFVSQFVGRLGWLSVILPPWTIVAYLFLLGFAALTDRGGIRMTTAHRVLCVTVAVIAMGSVFLGMWCAETTRAQKDAALQGIGYIAGVQGRYFIPFAFPLLLAMSGGRLKIERKWLLAIAAVIILLVNTVAVAKIRNTYYVSGDMGPYENKLVRRAGSTPEDGKVFVVRGGTRHWIIFGSWVEKHGYRWDDLKIIPPTEFNAIPEGKVIGEQ